VSQWYIELFDNYSRKYDQESYTSGTAGECDFIEQEIGFDRSVRILDIGCGTGRHSIELARRGYRVTGIDLSKSMLTRAEEKAAAKGLQIDFRLMDARDMDFTEEFELVIMLCEGAFPLMETDEMNFQILQNARKALKKGGKFIFTTLNGLFPLFHSVKEFCNKISGEENTLYKESSFDLLTFRDRDVMIVEDDDGNKKEIRCNERYYVPPEITWLLQSIGFRKIAIYGAELGKFSRDRRLTPDDFEMLIIAEV
jgi:SAM-dependent methyltransferase